MWDYLLAPLYVLLPERWRRRTGFVAPMHWRVASFICGVVQGVSGIAALAWWYSYSVTTWTAAVVSHAAATQSAMGELKPHAEGLLAFMIVASNPITWVIVVWCVEGLVRLLAAAFTEEVFATLPLALIVGAIALFRPVRAEHHGLQNSAYTVADATLDETPAHSFSAFLRRGFVERTTPHAPDHVVHLKDATGEFLKISASHTKPDWEVGRIVRAGYDFYRLESFTELHGSATRAIAHAQPEGDGLPHGATEALAATAFDGASRPFLYKLRRLPAGALNRHTLIYALPTDAAAHTLTPA